MNVYMHSNVSTGDGNEIDGVSHNNNTEMKCANDRKIQLVWRNIFLISIFHLGGIYGLYLLLTSAKLYTILFTITIGFGTGLGITAGAHRLWTHRSYKAKPPLQILLMILQTMAIQLSVIHWVRDHRTHHKYSDTNADPHNAKRGLFFSHVGWLLCRKRPEVIAKGKEIDISDVENDPILRFQNENYSNLVYITSFILPTLIPMIVWNETFTNAWFVCVMTRTIVLSNIVWSVNSFAHKYGNRPFDKAINPAENVLVSICALGEGWHNYHHAFPWDYKTGELGNYRTNFTTLFIDCMAKIGWAYDLKSVSPEMIKRRVERTGDGTHQTFGGQYDEDAIHME